MRCSFCELLYCDVDHSGRIGATDALIVLQRAVASNATLSCPTTTTTTVTSTTLIIDECFDDGDCVSYGDPDRPCCYGYRCEQCAVDKYCAPDKDCRRDGVGVPSP